MNRRAVGYWRDRKGRTRPITPKSPRKEMPAYRNREVGFWVERNGERVLMTESQIPEEYRLDVPMGFKYDKDPERYRRDSISYLENRVRGLKEQWFETRNEEDRELIKKLIPYFQSKIEEYRKYRLPHGDSTHSLHLYPTWRKTHSFRGGI
ncbi:MAG: hypothetical protein M0Z77_08805 [Thermoplasmatales archaeon]|nr:hypothetical protein [Thermoplasmatales archaeon]